MVFALADGGARAAEPSQRATVAQKRGRQVRKARQELTRARQLERAALDGRSEKPLSDMFRAEALVSRARARLRMIDALVDSGLAEPVRAYLRDARRAERRAERLDGDPGAQALFRQTLADAVGERTYWQRQGAYRRSDPPPRKRVSRSKPRIKVRSPEYLMAAQTAAGRRESARDRQAVNDAAQPSARPQMIRSRPLRFYAQAFGDRFERLLNEMDGSRTWIDVGAGTGAALAGYAQWRPEGARLIAVDLVDDARRVADRLPPGRMRVVQGDVTRVRGVGPATLVTDVFAAMSYGDAPDRVMRRYGQLVEPGGHLMLFVEEQRNNILSRDGRSREDLIGYLGRVEGFAIEDTRVFSEGTAVILRRTERPLKAPRLELVEFSDGGPPRRTFRMPSARRLAEPVASRFAPRLRR